MEYLRDTELIMLYKRLVYLYMIYIYILYYYRT